MAFERSICKFQFGSGPNLCAMGGYRLWLTGGTMVMGVSTVEYNVNK